MTFETVYNFLKDMDVNDTFRIGCPGEGLDDSTLSGSFAVYRLRSCAEGWGSQVDNIRGLLTETPYLCSGSHAIVNVKTASFVHADQDPPRRRPLFFLTI